ncbi:nucleolar transcription factor 1-B-like isoform X2 [Pomacea canaliculata]|nr:nucleolar transcription factor 1-B-like isoform X2 [Pomacea canaliculata]
MVQEQEMESTFVAKKHKKGKHKKHDHAIETDTEPSSSASNKEKDFLNPEEEKVEDTKEDLDSWTSNERLTLIESIRSQCPDNDSLSYKVREKKISWEKVTVSNHSAEQCRRMWQELQKQVRKHRTLPDLLHDAETVVHHPHKKKRKRHPDQPAKPLTPYILYIKEHREKVKAKNPGITLPDITRLLSQKWQSLSPRKREKYRLQYNKDREDFVKANEEFLQNHPAKKTKREGKPPALPFPFQCFYDAKISKYKQKHPNLSTSQLSAKLRAKYLKLKPSKKKKWISKAMESIPDYEKQLQEYLITHPEFKPPLRKIRLTKEEMVISKCSPEMDVDEITRQLMEVAPKDRRKKAKVIKTFPGAPEKPPKTAYTLFIKKEIGKLTVGSMTDKMTQLGKEWQSMAEQERKKYEKKLQRLKEDYELQVQEFEKTLSPEDLAKFRETQNNSRKKRKTD